MGGRRHALAQRSMARPGAYGAPSRARSHRAKARACGSALALRAGGVSEEDCVIQRALQKACAASLEAGTGERACGAAGSK
eukprot:6205459-Pleurochrysis_carterae.AAC.2